MVLVVTPQALITLGSLPFSPGQPHRIVYGKVVLDQTTTGADLVSIFIKTDYLMAFRTGLRYELNNPHSFDNSDFSHWHGLAASGSERGMWSASYLLQPPHEQEVPPFGQGLEGDAARLTGLYVPYT